MGLEKDAYEFGRFRLLVGEGILLRDGEPAPLPPKALDVLLVLVRHAGHVVGKAEIVEAVWRDTVVEEANLTQYISTLRKVLDEGAADSHIETFSKRGYRFVPPVRRLAEAELESLRGREQAAPSPVRDAPAGTPAPVDSTAPAKIRRPTAAGVAWSALTAIVVTASVIAFVGSRTPRPPPDDRVIVAVLPFENLSGDPEEEYVSDGLTEETIAQLGALNPERIGVIARTSVMRFKGHSRSVTEIGRELGADYLIEGSVRRDGNRVRVTTQLVQADDQSLLWSENFEKDWTGLIQIQKAVAEGIALTLAVELLPGTEPRVAHPGTSSAAAYEAYLKGRYFWNQRTLEGFERSLDLYKTALDLDPRYAAAWAGLANTHMLLRNYGYAPSQEMLREARNAALKAIELDPGLAAPRATLAGIAFDEGNWTEALSGFQRALEIDPNYLTGRQWYGTNLALLGRFDAAIAELEQAIELDPLSPAVNTAVGRVLYFAGRLDEAITALTATLELTPDYAQARFHLGLAYLEGGRYDRAITELETAAAGAESMWLGHAYARAGRRTDAIGMLERLQSRWERSGIQAEGIALVHLGLGNVEEAFTWLYQAVEDQSPGLTSLQAYPYWEPLRGDVRYELLVRRLGFPE